MNQRLCFCDDEIRFGWVIKMEMKMVAYCLSESRWREDKKEKGAECLVVRVLGLNNYPCV